MTEDVGEKLLPKFAKKAEEMNVHIEIVPNGSIEQLKELVALVARGEVSMKAIIAISMLRFSSILFGGSGQFVVL